MPAHALPRPTCRGTLDWLRWLGLNFWLLASVLSAGALLLLALDAVFAFPGDEPAWMTFAWMCIYLPLTFPLYLLVLVALSRLCRHPRRWAVPLAPIVLLVVFPLGLLFFGSDPGVTVLLLAYLGYGALAPIPLTPPASAATSR